MKEKLMNIEDAVSLIQNGDSIGLAIAADDPKAPVPMAIVREIIRQGKRRLTIFAPQATMEADMLIGSGCVSVIHYYAFRMFGLGSSANFRRAAESGSIETREHSEISMMLGVLAGSLGVPFIPIRGYYSDHIRHHPEWRTFISPLDGNELLAITSITPDVTILHVSKSDRYGNAQLEDTLKYNVGGEFFATHIVRASKKAIVSAEEIIPEEQIRANPYKTSIINSDVTAVVHIPHGAHPYGVTGYYEPDIAHIKQYFDAAKNVESFQDYISRYIRQPLDHWTYLKLIGISLY